ncbi:MAG: hypothetical protein WKG03_04400 [Telluria sp.]
MSGPSFAPFFEQLAVGGIVVAVLSIAAGLAILLVARTGAGQFLAMLTDKAEKVDKEQWFRERHKREQRNLEYRAWKKEKGIK